MEYEGNVYRPPGEWRSFLIQATIGCSHNGCTFCGMYKDKRFRIRPTEDILRDIEESAMIYNRYEKIFLCDGDAIIIKTDELLKIIEKLKKCFPYARLISTYAGPRSTLTKSLTELKELAHAGLGRAYLGVESGSDYVLKHTNKGVDSATMLEAGSRLVEAGIDLWAIILVGLGGTEKSDEHIMATAELINKMKPNHLSSMNYTPVPGTKLYDEILEGKFRVLSAVESLIETKKLIDNLSVEKLHFTSDHASNYLPIKGTLTEDKEKLSALLLSAIEGKTAIRSEFARGL